MAVENPVFRNLPIRPDAVALQQMVQNALGASGKDLQCAVESLFGTVIGIFDLAVGNLLGKPGHHVDAGGGSTVERVEHITVVLMVHDEYPVISGEVEVVNTSCPDTGDIDPVSTGSPDRSRIGA